MTVSAATGLTIEALACRRHDRLLFEDLSFGVSPGQILEVCGPNGSGKTTLLRLLCGLRQPDEGQISWQGACIDENPDSYREALCYLGHRPGLNADLSAVENLRLEAAIYAIEESRIRPALSELGLQREQDIACRQLSAGQRQRVALARLLLRPAALWILDEPGASLDIQAQQQIQSLMAGHAQDGGAVIFTTHQPLSIESVDVQQLMLGSAD